MVQNTTTIFVGAASEMQQLLDPAVSDPMLATGNVALYGHLSGVYSLAMAGEMQPLTALWSAAAPGVEENGVNTVAAKQTITIRNTTAQAIDAPVGTTVSTQTGVQFTVLMTRRGDGNWATGGSLGDGSWGHYVIQPGASIQVAVQALKDGPSGNVAAGAITGIDGVPGAQITASTSLDVALQVGGGTVTLQNTTLSDIVIAPGMLVQGSVAAGLAGQYQIGRDPYVAGYQPLNSDGSAWQYVLRAGSQITLPIYSVAPAYSASSPDAIIAAMQAENAPAGSITGGINLPSGVVVTASGAITPAGVTNPYDAATFGVSGPGTSNYTGRVQQWLTTQQGFRPSEANVNVDYRQLWTTLDLANWKSEVDALRAQGVMNVAPVWSENELSDVATSDAFANIRAAALYGGGISVDAPPKFVYDLAAIDSQYIPALESLFRWCTQNGLRSSMILSPDGGAGNDTALLANTQKLVARLQADQAMPSQFIMENYSQVAASVGDYFSATAANSMNNVATWLAGVKMTPTASESGLEIRGQAAADDIMTGVRPNETVSRASPLAPYDQLQLFSHATTTLQATVTLSSSAFGALSSGDPHAGTFAPDGTSFTVSGDAATVQSALRSLRFQAASGATGSGSLGLRIVDAAGTIEANTALVLGSVPVPPALEPTTSATAVTSLQLGTTPSVVVADDGETVSCGSGAATISADTGSVLVHGGGGTLVFHGGRSQATVTGGSGSATVIGGSGGGQFTGGASGGNVLVAGGGNTTLVGGGSADALFGSASGHDVLVAGRGRESLIGGGGGSTITGGLTAGAVIFTGGDTSVTGGPAGSDIIVGGKGALAVSARGDAVFAGSGATSVDGATKGADSIIGGSGSLSVSGHGGNMIVVGGTGTADISTGDGANLIFCGAGSMTLREGAGPSTVVGGSGSAAITAGAGSLSIDLVKGAAGGSDVIAGYRPASDRIALFGYAKSEVSVQHAGSSSVLSLSDGTRITLVGVSDPGASILG